VESSSFANTFFVYSLHLFLRNSPEATSDTISELFNVLDEHIDLHILYNNLPPETTYRLAGMVCMCGPTSFLCMFYPDSPVLCQICFYANHYVAFFFSTVKQVWLVFDDASVKVLGRGKGPLGGGIIFYRIDLVCYILCRT